MEKITESKKTLEETKEQILQKFHFAESHPMKLEEFEDFYYDKRSFSEDEIKKIFENFNNATVGVETLVEYRFLLEQVGAKNGWVEETLAHENAHANRGAFLGAIHEGYTITFVEKSDGKIQQIPAAIIDIPKTLSEADQKHIFIEVAQAPENYGGDNSYLSDGDIHRVNTGFKN